MNRILKSLWVVVSFFILTACSGGGTYSPEKCRELQEKIDSKQDLTDADYSEMINQVGAIINVVKEKNKEFGEDKVKEKEYYKSEEGEALSKYFLTFGFFLDSHSDQLSNSNKRKINKIMCEYEKEKKQ